MNLEECREWIRQHQADSDDDAARALLSLLASKTDREERARLRAIVGAAYEHENARHQEVTLRRLLHYILTDVEALLAERARLATDSGIKSELLEEIANGSTPPTRTSIQARHDEMWTEARKVVADRSPPLRPRTRETT